MKPFSCVAVLLLVGSVQHEATAQPAPSQDDVARARELFERGVELLENDDWAPALVLLQRSFELRPTQVALFNIGLCLEAMHRYREAIATFERLLREFATSGSENRLRLAQDEIRNMRALMGSLRIAISVSGAEVRVDGHVVGTSPVAGPIQIVAGTHTVTAGRDGFEPVEQRVVIEAGETATVDLTLSPIAPVRSVRRSDAPHSFSRGLRPVWFWSAAAFAGVAAITTGVLAAVVIAGSAEYEASDPRTADDQETGKRMMRITDVAFGVTVLAAAGALILYTQTDFEREAETTSHSAATSLVPNLRLDPDGVAVGLEGGF